MISQCQGKLQISKVFNQHSTSQFRNNKRKFESTLVASNSSLLPLSNNDLNAIARLSKNDLNAIAI